MLGPCWAFVGSFGSEFGVLLDHLVIMLGLD
jgi:hypothetical protein